MKITKLTVEQIAELQPTAVALAVEKGTVLGGIEISGDYDAAEVRAAATTLFGAGCAGWDNEPEDGDDCLHLVIYAASLAAGANA